MDISLGPINRLGLIFPVLWVDCRFGKDLFSQFTGLLQAVARHRAKKQDWAPFQ